MLNRLLLVVACVVGVLIAYVDSRPSWNDAGITAFSMLLSAAAFTLLSSRRPWLWALAVGVWIPAHAIVRSPSLSSLAMLLVLAFPFAGAYLGLAIRHVLALV